MAPSTARQTANAANAQLSTGPRTPEGKRRSSENARTHGLTAQDLVIGPEDLHEFNDMLAGFQADVAPQGALQQALFDELVSSAWNLRRIRRMEADAIQTKLDRLARHKVRIECTFHRSLKELKALQTTAALRSLLPSDAAESVPPLASNKEIAKRTQATARFPGGPVDFAWIDPALESEQLAAASQAVA
jgi:hypothetical protein